MANPERDVIADIDALEAEWAEQDAVIDHNLVANRGFDDYRRDWHDRQGDVKCPVCMEEWHGLQRDACPGAYATEEEKRVYFARHPSRTHIDMSSRSGRRRAFQRQMSQLESDAGITAGGYPRVSTTWVHVQQATPEMQAALVEHVTRYPEDEDHLMRRFRDLIFTPDGRPVPWTQGGLRTVLGGDENRVRWAQRQLGIVDLGATTEE